MVGDFITVVGDKTQKSVKCPCPKDPGKFAESLTHGWDRREVGEAELLLFSSGLQGLVSPFHRLLPPWPPPAPRPPLWGRHPEALEVIKFSLSSSHISPTVFLPALGGDGPKWGRQPLFPISQGPGSGPLRPLPAPGTAVGHRSCVQGLGLVPGGQLHPQAQAKPPP